MACPPRAGDRVGAEAAWTEGLDINLVQRARAPHRERHAGARAHHRRRRRTRTDRAQQRLRWTGARASGWRARLLLRFATATPTVLTARPPDGHGALPPLRPCARVPACERARRRTRCAPARVWFQAVPCVARSESRSAAHALHTILSTIHFPSGTLYSTVILVLYSVRRSTQYDARTTGRGSSAAGVTGPPALALAPN